MSFSVSVLPRSCIRRLRSYRVLRMPERLRSKSIRPLRIRMRTCRSNFEDPPELYCQTCCNGFGERNKEITDDRVEIQGMGAVNGLPGAAFGKQESASATLSNTNTRFIPKSETSPGTSPRDFRSRGRVLPGGNEYASFRRLPGRRFRSPRPAKPALAWQAPNNRPYRGY